MNRNGSSFSRRGSFRLVFIAAFLLAGTMAAPLGARAVGDVVIDSSGFYAGQTVYVADGPLNVRSGAGTGYTVIELLATGDYLTIEDGPYSADGYQWYGVTVDWSGTYGYVAGVFLAPVSGAFAVGDTVYVTSDTLNVRSGPGTGYTVIDVMSYGQNGLVVDGPVYSNGYTWYELNYVGGTADGWVAGEYLGLVATGGFAIGDTVAVDSITLNVRSGPGTGYTITDVFSYGDQSLIIDGPVYSDGYTWYEVTYGGGYYSGWVAGEYLVYVSGGGFAIGQSVYVTAGTLNVRDGAGTGYAIVDYLNYGATATIVDGPYYANGYTWYEIEYSDPLYGWVAGEYLAAN